MTTVTYEAFLPHVYPLVPNAPEPSAVIAIRNTCIDFCKGSLFLREQLDPISTAAGIADYEIDVPRDMVLAQVISLYFCGDELKRKSVSELAARYTRDWMLMSGTPSAYTQLVPNEVKLVLAPATTDALSLTGLIALSPARSSTKIEQRVFEQYVDIIAQGAAARLYAIPNQPFTDPQASMAYYKLFSAGVANTRAAVNTGLNRAPIQVHFDRAW